MPGRINLNLSLSQIQKMCGLLQTTNLCLVINYIASNPFAQVPTTRAFRGRLAAEEHRSEVLRVNLPAHKSKATKEAQEVRKKNAQATKRYRENRRAEAKAAAIKKEIAMKQELDDANTKLQIAEERSRQDKAEIERLRRVDAEKDAEKRRADAEIERLRRENEELKQRK
ncbi:hypothetical protein E4U57_001800 [Claviceps arundinis]|uniref:BZIP domain-containing protein n=1 Tax=Claviceps arundinis TaxID=1623583 RepID=A0ABQ7PKS9_9HYPO|nr:hypothetical protein E4U57_001800 [Claviceps arundinis]